MDRGAWRAVVHGVSESDTDRAEHWPHASLGEAGLPTCGFCPGGVGGVVDSALHCLLSLITAHIPTIWQLQPFPGFFQEPEFPFAIPFFSSLQRLCFLSHSWHFPVLSWERKTHSLLLATVVLPIEPVVVRRHPIRPMWSTLLTF